MNEKSDYNKSEHARKLYFSKHDGVLSTVHRIGSDIEGYPYGSVVPFCLDRNGEIVIVIANVAQHTRNIKENRKVSITIREDVESHTQVQPNARLTYIGNAEQIPDDETDQIRDRFVRYLPSAKKYIDSETFHMYRIKLVKARFIGGFGKIFWLDPYELLLENPFSEEDEKSILEHMNEDHHEAMFRYLTDSYDIETDFSDTEDYTEMIGIDSIGCDIRYNGIEYRIWFDNKVKNKEEAREELVRMAREE